MTQRNLTLIHLTELIRTQELDQVSPEITDERFPTPDRLWNDYKKFRFEQHVLSEEAVKRMQAEGYEPANSHELLLWDEWNEEDSVVALGSFMEINGNRPVLYLYKDGWRRNLCFTWSDGVWNTSCHFLAVRRSFPVRQPFVRDHYY